MGLILMVYSSRGIKHDEDQSIRSLGHLPIRHQVAVEDTMTTMYQSGVEITDRRRNPARTHSTGRRASQLPVTGMTMVLRLLRKMEEVTRMMSL
jgi:hypothetical protein